MKDTVNDGVELRERERETKARGPSTQQWEMGGGARELARYCSLLLVLRGQSAVDLVNERHRQHVRIDHWERTSSMQQVHRWGGEEEVGPTATTVKGRERGGHR